MNIKIGNDIRLNVVLNDQYSFEITDIKKIKAYLTNTSNVGTAYPNQTYPLYYNASGYNTNNCGVPTYYTLPYDHGFNGLYTGFGYNPRHTNYNNQCVNSFFAPHTLNKEEGSIQVYFPASQQLTVGTYKLTLVLDVYNQFIFTFFISIVLLLLIFDWCVHAVNKALEWLHWKFDFTQS